MGKPESETIFVRASTLYESGLGQCTFSRGWHSLSEMDGVKRFKRRALGFFRLSGVKSSDEMAKLLYETRIAHSVEEGRKITPTLAGKSFPYSTNLAYDRELNIQRVAGCSKGHEMYKLYVSFPSDPAL